MNSPLVKLEDLHQFDNLELLAKQVVEGSIIGLHKSPFHGFSVEFAEHRLYNQGESTKNIDWKVFARSERLYTKQFEEETNLRCQLILDISSSMYFPENEENNKIRFSAVCALAILNLLKKQRDAFGLSTFSNELEVHTNARSSTVHQQMILEHLHQYVNGERQSKATDAVNCLHQIADSIAKRSLVVIFSDMFDKSMKEDKLDELFSALQHLKHAKHEVILFHVTNKKLELDFEFENRPYQFIDLESGEKIKLHANQVKDEYVKQLKSFKEELSLRCGQYKIDFVEADMNKPFAEVLVPYMLKRTKML